MVGITRSCIITMAVSHQRNEEHGSCSVREADRLLSPSLVLEAWGIPRELLGFSLCGKLEGVGSNINEGMQRRQQQNK